MLRRLHDRLGTAGVVISVIALVAALTGTAFAASGALTSKQKKEVTKIAKKYAGKPGAQGAAGPQGPAGPKGDSGSAGKDGANGTNGTNGVSATTTSFSGAKGSCTAGGIEVKSASPSALVCNGQTGFIESLPSGKSLYGMWSALMGPDDPSAFASISFGIPLPGAPAVGVKLTDGEVVAGCPGTAAAPSADKGFVCFYKSGGASLQLAFEEGTKGGAVLAFFREAVGSPQAIWGTWAATAE